jgi:DNA-binding GntR family transcriptional regulator
MQHMPSSHRVKRSSFGNKAELIGELSIKGGAPLYRRLAETLLKKIEEGAYKAGDRFPGDKDLSAQYGVSLITVRAALRLLMERGVIGRHAGRGSFVLRQKPIRAQWGLGSIDELAETGLQAKMLIVNRKLTRAPKWVAQKYFLSPDAKVFWFRTVRTNQGERFLLNDIYHAPKIGSRIYGLDFNLEIHSKKLMIALVEKYCGVRLNNMDQTMGAELASAHVAKQLGIRVGCPILVVDRDYYSSDGNLIQVTRSRYRLDHYHYTINVARLADNSVERSELMPFFDIAM